jgi:hypothetical protein
MKVEYDPKCVELAQWFLDDAYKANVSLREDGRIYDERLVNDLAGVIQSAIEGWFALEASQTDQKAGAA